MTDVQRFEAFVLAHQDMVFATAVRLLGRAAEAEDIAQTAFLKAWEQFGALRDNPAAGGWLKTVTTNLCLNHLSRYRSRWSFFSELARPDGAGGDTNDFEAGIASPESPADAFERADERARLARALQALPAHQRVPIVLFHFDHWTYEEIATRLGVSVGKVKTDIHRGRLALKAVLGSLDGTH